MQKSKRKLKDELLQHDSQISSIKMPDCALEQKLSCCDGIGFRIATEGAFLKAELCSCVSSCPSCFGKARHMTASGSKQCRNPNPSRVVSILNTAMIPARYASVRLEQFSNFTGNGRNVCQAIQGWSRNFKRKESRGLLMSGPVGVGKTYILAAIAKSFAYRGFTVRFVDFFQLLNELKAGYANEKADSTTINSLINVDLLVIDELGKGRNSDWELSIIDQLVMGRYNQNKPIVASTNYSLRSDHRVELDLESQHRGFDLNQFESLETRVGERIYSRLIETCLLVELTGQDYRKRYIEEKQQFLQLDPQS